MKFKNIKKYPNLMELLTSAYSSSQNESCGSTSKNFLNNRHCAILHEN